MSLSQLMREHVSTVFMNTDHFADTVYRLVGGDDGNIKPIVGIAGDDMPAVDDGRGRGYTHTRSFDFAEAIQLQEKDAIRIGTLRYEVEHVSDPVHGMKTAKLVRYKAEAKGAKVLRNGDL